MLLKVKLMRGCFIIFDNGKTVIKQYSTSLSDHPTQEQLNECTANVFNVTKEAYYQTKLYEDLKRTPISVEGYSIECPEIFKVYISDSLQQLEMQKMNFSDSVVPIDVRNLVSKTVSEKFGIHHNDLNLGNIKFSTDKNKIYMIDFGSADKFWNYSRGGKRKRTIRRRMRSQRRQSNRTKIRKRFYFRH